MKNYIYFPMLKKYGAIGGGILIYYFQKNVKSYIIISPYFFEINGRFKFSLENTDYKYYYETKIYKKEENTHSIYSRVKIKDIKSKYFNKIGEIIDVENNKYKINISNNDIAGFNNKVKFESIICTKYDFDILDKD